MHNKVKGSERNLTPYNVNSMPIPSCVTNLTRGDQGDFLKINILGKYVVSIGAFPEAIRTTVIDFYIILSSGYKCQTATF